MPEEAPPAPAQPAQPAAPASIIQGIPGPDKLTLDGDSAVNLKRFKRSWTVYEVGSRINTLNEEVRASILQSYLSADVLEILESLPCEEADKNKVDKILDRLERHFIGNVNETFERYKFNIRVQKASEPFDTFLGACRVLIKSCNYGDLEDNLLRDKIVFGTNKEATRRKLLANSNLTLEKAVNMCRADESADIQATEIGKQNASESEVHKVRVDVNNKQNKQSAQQRNNRPVTQNPREIKSCKFCGRSHIWKKEECPAYGKRCSRCNQFNHFAVKCPNDEMNVRNVNESSEREESQNDDYETTYGIGNVQTINKVNKETLCAELLVNDRPIVFQLDTGASSCLISQNDIGPVKLSATASKLVMWNGSRIDPVGECSLKVTNKKTRTTYPVKFIVVSQNFKPLLGLTECVKMGLVSINEEKFNRVYVNTVENVPIKGQQNHQNRVFFST